MKTKPLFLDTPAPSPTLQCRFDCSHALFKRKSDAKPLLELHCKGDFRLGLIPLAVSLACGVAAIAAAAVCAHYRKHR